MGIREVINDEEVEEVFAVLRKKDVRMPTNWSRRYKNHVEKLKSGDIYQVAEVVRNLSNRDKDKGLSAGEKRMLGKARQILVSELTFAIGVPEAEAEKSSTKPCPSAAPSPADWAVVVAGGSGTRFGGYKQFAMLAGRQVVEWSLASRRGTLAPVWCWWCRPSVVALLPWRGAIGRRGRRGPPARRRCGPVFKPSRDDAEIVVVHDAARPLASTWTWEAVIAAVRRRGRRRRCPAWRWPTPSSSAGRRPAA